MNRGNRLWSETSALLPTLRTQIGGMSCPQSLPGWAQNRERSKPCPIIAEFSKTRTRQTAGESTLFAVLDIGSDLN